MCFTDTFLLHHYTSIIAICLILHMSFQFYTNWFVYLLNVNVVKILDQWICTDTAFHIQVGGNLEEAQYSETCTIQSMFYMLKKFK